MKNNTLFVFNAEANNKKQVNNNTLFVYDAEANKNNKKKWFTWGVRKLEVVKLVFVKNMGLCVSCVQCFRLLNF